jgi:rubredoxin
MLLLLTVASSYGFHVPPITSQGISASLLSNRWSSSSSSLTAPTPRGSQRRSFILRNNADSSSDIKATVDKSSNSKEEDDDDEEDPMAAAMMDAETRLALEKAKKANELRAQEVFMTKSTGKHKCTNCEWEYDESKGDAMMIGGMIKPGTKFEELPSNWRCPVCRASKDSFQEVVEEIPGFAVNQGYGLGTNAWTSDQKSAAIFGGLFFFFLLFLSGYALS